MKSAIPRSFLNPRLSPQSVVKPPSPPPSPQPPPRSPRATTTAARSRFNASLELRFSGFANVMMTTTTSRWRNVRKSLNGIDSGADKTTERTCGPSEKNRGHKGRSSSSTEDAYGGDGSRGYSRYGP